MSNNSVLNFQDLLVIVLGTFWELIAFSFLFQKDTHKSISNVYSINIEYI